MPATKLVLWHLCDRHNPDFGCFPSQDQLAADVEISALVAQHAPRKAGSGGADPQASAPVDEAHTGSRNPPATFWASRTISGASHVQNSGHGKPQKPCPDFGKSHVQNLDTNLVREPVTTTAREADAIGDAEAACLAACGEGLSPASRTAITATRQVIDGLAGAGLSIWPPTSCPRWPSGPSASGPTRSGRGSISPRRSPRAMPNGWRRRQRRKVLGKRRPCATASRAEILAFDSRLDQLRPLRPNERRVERDARRPAGGRARDRGRVARQADLLNPEGGPP